MEKKLSATLPSCRYKPSENIIFQIFILKFNILLYFPS